ncbi:uncharacterized protein LOC129838088 [Salvelinus fontinalis]|uniref:uncharacterized protein LOC129838088 n=1 Tax=Salvelinus fontinalis TaxID=8038 RepID=UPI00248574FF|nr:uncharacterized protein LOC129838088 [Salvelinus fontinalis]XP_055760777.1 uncharacterized protein LOC129838088 [Salvelinus fontinalis]
MLNTSRAAFWSSPSSQEESCYRITHQTRTKQRGNGQQRQQQQQSQELWTWEQNLDYTTWEEIDRWAIDPGRMLEPAWDSLEQCEEGYQRMEAIRRCGRKPERQPKTFLGGWLKGSVAKSGRRPAPTSRAYGGEREYGQTPWYAEERTVSPVRVLSPVRYIPAPRIGRARVGIEPGAMKPAQRIWSSVRLLGPVYMAPALRMVSAVRQHSPVRAIPPRRTGLATGSIQPGKVGHARCLRAPVRLHGPVYPVPPPRPSLVPPLLTPRTRLPVCLQSPVPPRTRTVVCYSCLIMFNLFCLLEVLSRSYGSLATCTLSGQTRNTFPIMSFTPFPPQNLNSLGHGLSNNFICLWFFKPCSPCAMI